MHHLHLTSSAPDSPVKLFSSKACPVTRPSRASRTLLHQYPQECVKPCNPGSFALLNCAEQGRRVSILSKRISKRCTFLPLFLFPNRALHIRRWRTPSSSTCSAPWQSGAGETSPVVLWFSRVLLAFNNSSKHLVYIKDSSFSNLIDSSVALKKELVFSQDGPKHSWDPIHSQEHPKFTLQTPPSTLLQLALNELDLFPQSDAKCFVAQVWMSLKISFRI